MLQQDKSDDYVVATGIGASVRDFCNACFASLDLDYRDFVEVEDRYRRPTEVPALIGDSTKAKEVIGWQPKTYWAELAALMTQSDLMKFSKKLS